MAHAPAEMFPIDDTHDPCCDVIADPASQFSFAASTLVTPEEVLTTEFTSKGAGSCWSMAKMDHMTLAVVVEAGPSVTDPVGEAV